ncbi:MAG: hypothetical protein K0S65_2143 [Labilithrix sp.]|nr:hypothetical protein [Labilithrix sp.]
MTSERFNPPRADEQGPEALRALVRERRRGPSPDAVNEITARIAARTTEAASGTAARSESALAYSKLGALVVVVAGGLLLAPMASRSFALRSTVAAPPVAAPDPAPEPARERSEASPKVDPIGTISVHSLPTAAPAVAAASAPRPSSVVPSAKSSPSADAPPSVSELEVARRAQAMLASNPGRALAMADQLARDFPNGEFVQEREAIAVEALARVGRKEEALQRARALLRRFPRTPYAARLEMVIGQPISPTSAASPTPTR